VVADIEKGRLRVFENRVLRRTFGAKRDEATEKCRKLQKQELNLYCSLNTVQLMKSRIMRLAGHVARLGERRIQGFCWKNPEGKRPLGRPSCRWEDNIKMKPQ
jgi:hypothetical protein